MSGYRKLRETYGDYAGSVAVTAFIGTTTLAPAKADQAIYVQRVHIQVAVGQAATTWSIEDSAGRPVTGSVSAVTSPIGFDFDFGEAGVPLTTGASLSFVPSSTGAQGSITWEAYRRQVGTLAM